MGRDRAAALATFVQALARASDWRLCACAAASSTFCVLELPYQLVLFDFQLVERSPHFACFRSAARSRWRMLKRAFAISLAVPIAMRVGRKGEQNVLPYWLCQVDRLGAGQLHLAGKIFDFQRVTEALPGSSRIAIRGRPRAARSQKDRRRSDRHRARSEPARPDDVRLVQVENAARLFSFHMPPFGRDLLSMNLHNTMDFWIVSPLNVPPAFAAHTILSQPALFLNLNVDTFRGAPAPPARHERADIPSQPRRFP